MLHYRLDQAKVVGFCLVLTSLGIALGFEWIHRP